MGVVSWLVVAGAAAGGYYCYRRLREIEGEIRAEEKQPASSPAAAPSSSPPGTAAAGEMGEKPLGDRLAEAVAKEPGILQTELYRRFSGENRRTLQDEIRRLVDSGTLRRQKDKNTYRVFPDGE